jgi:hypothetical protein
MKTKIKKYKFKHGLPVDFEVINIPDLYRRHKNILSIPHRVDFYHIIWVQKGSPTHVVDFKQVTINTNSILFVTKDCINLFDPAGDYDGKIIVFTDTFFCKNPNDIQFLQSTILYNDMYEITQMQVNDSGSELSNILKAMETELSKPNDYVQYDILRNQLLLL